MLDQAIDTSTPAGRLLFNVLGSIAEFERDLVRERTKAGVTAAQRRGKRVGRSRAISNQGLERVRRLQQAGRSISHIARVLNVSRASVLRELRRMDLAQA